ncbi:MAG: metal-dependent hydrolase [Synergistaceae bacterium]|jgi:L-ascorbate metabolism protein UlaG (beta-lactamase superfamily)|nr:metal-dependent hydrolase [Synergistaceae bacterium]
MKIEYLGHSCFLMTVGNYKILTDPFLDGNEHAAIKASEVDATHILVSHGHADHLGDAEAIAVRCGATVYATVETAALLPDTVKKEVGQPGGWVPTAFGRVKFTSAIHGSGAPGGVACGFIIDAGTIDPKGAVDLKESVKVYHAGDTALTMDMTLLGDERIDVALLPIGDKFTMGPRDALRASRLVRPSIVIPMHYNTWPIIAQDAEAFKASVEADEYLSEAEVKVVVMAVGDSLEV